MIKSPNKPQFTVIYHHETSLSFSKLTVRPWKSSGLEDEFQLDHDYFQGQTVNLLPEGESFPTLLSLPSIDRPEAGR